MYNNNNNAHFFKLLKKFNLNIGLLKCHEIETMQNYKYYFFKTKFLISHFILFILGWNMQDMVLISWDSLLY